MVLPRQNLLSKPKIKYQNNRWLTVSPKDVPRTIQMKFPVTNMAFGVITSEGDVKPPQSFPEGLKLNTYGNICILKEVVKPWVDQVVAGRLYMWQQESVPYHTNWKAQAWLSENLANHTLPDIWSPNSLSATPLTFLCGAWSNETPTDPAAT